MEEIQDKLLQIGIFPRRLLEPATVEKLLNEIVKINGITRIFLQGPDLPARTLRKPLKDSDPDHLDRRIIAVGNMAFELTVRVGKIFVEIESDAEEDLKSSCEIALHILFEFKRGRFFKRIPTTSDYSIYGIDKNGQIDLDDKRKLGLANKKAGVAEPILIMC